MRNHCRVQTSPICVSAFVPFLVSCVGDSALGHDRCVLGLKESSSKCHPHSCTYIVTSVLWFCVFLPIPLLVMISGCLCKFVWWLIYSCADLCWLLWTRLYGSVVRAVDCRSAGPWFNSGWKSWFMFMTCSDNPMNQISQMFISKSSITRNSVKMVAELDHGTAQWIFDNPKLDTVFGERNMTGEQQTAAPTVSAAQAPPFTAEQQSFLEEFMMVQHLNHETAIHQLQPSNAEELRMIRQEAEDARRTEHMRNRFVLKDGKPDVWNPDKTPFLEWDHRWRAYMGMCSTSILSDLQNIRENPKRVLIYSDFDSARQQASNEVYFSLVMLTTGKAATIVRTVRDNNGYEAYRVTQAAFRTRELRQAFDEPHTNPQI